MRSQLTSLSLESLLLDSINVSDREFLEFMLRPGTAGRNILTGVLELLKRGRSTGVCEVSVLETGCIVGSIDRRP